jgi:Cft2 family RNA processing exonuclease
MDDRERQARASVRRYESAAEADRDDLAFWMQMSDSDRILQVWRLSEQLWRLRGDMTDEPGLCRSVARVRRR